MSSNFLKISKLCLEGLPLFRKFRFFGKQHTKILHHSFNGIDSLLEILSGFVILRIFVLYIGDIIIAYPQSLKVLALLEYACSLSEVHNCLGILFFKKIVDFKSPRVEQLLKELLQLLDLGRRVFLRGVCLPFVTGFDVQVSVLELHCSQPAEEKLQRSKYQVAYLVGYPSED